jgi:hypothetical protein
MVMMTAVLIGWSGAFIFVRVLMVGFVMIAMLIHAIDRNEGKRQMLMAGRAGRRMLDAIDRTRRRRAREGKRQRHA